MGFLAWVLGAVLVTAGGTADSESDPGYILYKEGYALILDERWDEARGAFDLLLRRHPRSEYADEAEYWRAYALGHLDPRVATDA